MFFFFFSSRRRHTRCSRDWSSDVCSSDLIPVACVLGRGKKMIQLKVNGVEQSFDGEPEMPLLWYLRDVLDLTGSKFGCGAGLCGACTVHVNGQATRSCLTTMRDAAGKEVTTIEGLDKDGLHPVQRVWMEINVPQCGYCQAGQIMQAAWLLGRIAWLVHSREPCRRRKVQRRTRTSIRSSPKRPADTRAAAFQVHRRKTAQLR